MFSLIIEFREFFTKFSISGAPCGNPAEWIYSLAAGAGAQM